MTIQARTKSFLGAALLFLSPAAQCESNQSFVIPYERLDSGAGLSLDEVSQEIDQVYQASFSANLPDWILSRRMINVNLDIFRSNVSMRLNDNNFLRVSNESLELIFSPNSDLALRLNLKKIERSTIGSITFSGTVEDVEESHFVLNIHDDQMRGQVSVGTIVYKLGYESSTRTHYIDEIDLTSMPKHAPDPKLIVGNSHALAERNSKSKWKDSLESLSNPTNGNVRVLVLYENGLAGAVATANNLIATANDSLRYHELDFDLHFTLAGTRQLTGNNSGLNFCKGAVIQRMSDAIAPFANIDNWLEDVDADIAMTISEPGAGCNGYDAAGGQAVFFDSDNPFAVSYDDYALADYTAIHEIGHVLGGGHEDQAWENFLDQDPHPDGVVRYGRGLSGMEEGWQTMMGSYVPPGCTVNELNDPNHPECVCLFDLADGSNQDCIRLLKWSDPNRSHNGVTLGVADTQTTHGSDMKSALEIQMAAAASWNDFPGSKPPKPTSFTVSSMSCYGQNSVSWSSVASATHYQLLKSYSSSFSSPELTYQGTAIGLIVNVSQGQNEFFKVRSCNGDGCSAISHQQTATWYSGCL